MLIHAANIDGLINRDGFKSADNHQQYFLNKKNYYQIKRYRIAELICFNLVLTVIKNQILIIVQNQKG